MCFDTRRYVGDTTHPELICGAPTLHPNPRSAQRVPGQKKTCNTLARGLHTTPENSQLWFATSVCSHGSVRRVPTRWYAMGEMVFSSVVAPWMPDNVTIDACWRRSERPSGLRPWQRVPRPPSPWGRQIPRRARRAPPQGEDGRDCAQEHCYKHGRRHTQPTPPAPPGIPVRGALPDG